MKTPEFILRGAFVAIALVFFVIRMRAALHARIREPGVVNVRESKWVWATRILVVPFFLFIAFGWVLTPSLAQWTMVPLPLPVRYAGVVIGLVGLALIYWVHWALGRYFSPFLRIRADHELIQIGPYRRVRHPMYTAFLLIMAAFTLMAASWPFAVATVIMYFAIIRHRTVFEEQMLVDRFGSAYEEYRGRTGALLPRW